jgi:hypothetical protein
MWDEILGYLGRVGCHRFFLFNTCSSRRLVKRNVLFLPPQRWVYIFALSLIPPFSSVLYSSALTLLLLLSWQYINVIVVIAVLV